MNGTELSERHVDVLGGDAGIGLETSRLLTSRGAGDDRRPRPRRLAGVVAQLDAGDRVRPVVVDAERVDLLRAFFAAAGPITGLVVTVTRRGGARPARDRRPGRRQRRHRDGRGPLAAELAPWRVNAVSPDVIETGWWDEIPADVRDEMLKSFAERAPVRRNGHPRDFAQAAVALLENGYITGVVLPCDGGLRLT